MLKRRLLIAGLAALVPLPTAAHHGFRGRYDRSKPFWLEGAVRNAYFGQPHAAIRIDPSVMVRPPDVAAAVEPFADGLQAWPVRDEVEIEFPPVRLFFELDGRIQLGDLIAVIALQNCEPLNQLRGQAVRLSNGEWIVRSGRMQSEVASC